MTEKEILRRVFHLIKPHSGRLSIAMVSMVMVAGLSAGQAYMVKPLLDEIFFKQDRLMLNILPFALVALFLAKGVSYYSYSYMLERVGYSVIRDLRKRMYAHIQALPLPFFSKTTTGELVARIISDVVLMQAAVSSALVGPSGGGKSTIANLIPRFFEVSRGQILIDGLDIRDVSLSSLRKQIAVVTQHTILFNDTVKNNIAYGDPDCPKEKIIAAAKAANALEFIEQLPQGLDTVNSC